VSPENDGILSERDIVRAVAESGSTVLQLPVAQVMTRQVSTGDVNESIDSVMEGRAEVPRSRCWRTRRTSEAAGKGHQSELGGRPCTSTSFGRSDFWT
jgi:CBS domain-containing protein